MKILPPRTLLPEVPFERRHTPKPSRRWGDYRSCLRWDFGFTCPFCLLHEADIFGGLRAEGWGVITVEHREPRVDKPDKAGDYDNCTYACSRCNRARSKRPVEFARELIEDHLSIVELPRAIVRLSELADRLLREKRDYDGFQQVVATIQRSREAIQRGLRDLRRYAAVPTDAPETCRCETADHHTLPEALVHQPFDLPDAF